MKRFENILVGVDLANDDRLVADKLSDATSAAIDNGLWVAKRSNAKLLFFNALEVPEYARFVEAEQSDVESTLIKECKDRLSALVQRANAENIDAEHALVFGKSWVEIIRKALNQQHDLVITGTRRRGPAASVLFGSTGMKLLRKCPCPVWITKPCEHRQVTSILVADDLSPASEMALELGVSMACLHQAQLHVLHVLELGMGRHGWDTFKIRERARSEAKSKLEAQLSRIETGGLQAPPSIEIVVDAADTAIMHQIERRNVDLLVMGTIARCGIAGVLTGNTAERLLPRIRCSVLAVKPHDFVCPLSAE